MVNCACAHENVIFWCFNCKEAREINIKIIIEQAHKLFVTRVHALFVSLGYMESINDDTKLRSSHIDPLSHSLGLRPADNATMNCSWHHKCISRHSNCDERTWKAISKLLDIDFIPGHIHGRSGAKMQ